MPDVLLSFYCARADGAAIADALREATHTPVHLRDELVFGLDFSDASTAERVSGQLNRCVVELTVAGDMVDTLVQRIADLKRAAPVRWQVAPVSQSGRIA